MIRILKEQEKNLKEDFKTIILIKERADNTARFALMYVLAALKQKSKRGFISIKDAEELFSRVASMKSPKNAAPYMQPIIKTSGVIDEDTEWLTFPH